MEHGNGHTTRTVKEAADILGISPRGVRQRITRGRLKATQINGEWLVFLGEQAEQEESSPEQREEEQPRAERREQIPQAVNTQFQAVMDTWISPLTKTIQEQAEEIGKLKAELVQRDSAIAQLSAALDEDDGKNISPARRTGFWAGFFRR